MDLFTAPGALRLAGALGVAVAVAMMMQRRAYTPLEWVGLTAILLAGAGAFVMGKFVLGTG